MTFRSVSMDEFFRSVGKGDVVSRVELNEPLGFDTSYFETRNRMQVGKIVVKRNQWPLDKQYLIHTSWGETS